MEKLRFREFQKADTEALVRIICETWHYQQFSSPKTAKKLAKAFLYSCLANQTYTRVALQDGVPLGIIMGKNRREHRGRIGGRIKQAFSILSLFLSAEGRRVSKIFACVEKIDQELLKEAGTDYQGELCFFALSPAARGKGIGKQLFQRVLAYMRSQNIGRFFLFTDTSCNYGFYEHQGMVRRGVKEHLFFIGGREAKMEFYLYEYQM